MTAAPARLEVSGDGGKRLAIRQDFGFIGRLCLDFAQTGDMGWGAQYERLTRPSELGRWLALSPLQLGGVRVSRSDLERALVLRGTIWRLAQAALGRETIRVGDVRRLNADARRSALARELTSDGRSLRWHRPSAAAALATIAQDAVALFGDSHQRERLRHCENSQCRVVFYDDSRPGSRRWCAPNRCGDRMRARDYRRRRA
jgi:predicted RNA-binding Zn ribbon-like protein